MPEQFSLTGFDTWPHPAHGLFFAIHPDVDAGARIAQHARRLRDEYGLKASPLATKRFHVSLHRLGGRAELPHGIVALANEVAASVMMPPFDVRFDRAMSFRGRPGSRPLVLLGSDGVTELIAFQQVLGTAMKQAGLGRWVDAEYKPHLTLLYDSRSLPEQRVEPVSWTVREFVIVHSLRGQSRHSVLGRWLLRG